MKKTVPLRIGEKVVGTAEVESDAVGIRVLSTDITDPDMLALLTEVAIGPMHISYHDGLEEK